MASAFDAATAAAEALFLNSAPGVMYSDRIAWPNVAFTPPAADYWLRLTWLMGRAEMKSMQPEAMNHLPGLLQIDVFVPDNDAAGMGTGYQIADAVRDVFSRVSSLYPPLWFGAASAPREVRSVETGWRHLMVEVPVTIEEST